MDSPPPSSSTNLSQEEASLFSSQILLNCNFQDAISSKEQHSSEFPGKKWFEREEMAGSRLTRLTKKDLGEEKPSSGIFPSISLPVRNEFSSASITRSKESILSTAFSSNSQRRPVIKITNFPWEITKDDICDFLADFQVEETKVHIPIDRTTGKTKNESFIELKELANAEKCVATLNRKILKGRPVAVQSSSFTELFNTHFPFAVPEQNLFLTREEVNSILAVCKNYKMHFSRRCAQRPFEHICSILYLLPWKILNVATRDAIFEMVKQGLEFLTAHLYKPVSILGEETLERYMKAANWFPIFTERQKKILQQVIDNSAPILDYKVQKKISTLAIESNSIISVSSCDETVPKSHYESTKEMLEQEIEALRKEIQELRTQIAEEKGLMP